MVSSIRRLYNWLILCSPARGGAVYCKLNCIFSRASVFRYKNSICFTNLNRASSSIAVHVDKPYLVISVAMKTRAISYNPIRCVDGYYLKKLIRRDSRPRRVFLKSNDWRGYCYFVDVKLCKKICRINGNPAWRVSYGTVKLIRKAIPVPAICYQPWRVKPLD